MLRTLRSSLFVLACLSGFAVHADRSHDPRLEAILAAENSIEVVCDYTYKPFEFLSCGRAFYIKKLQNSRTHKYSHTKCRSVHMVTDEPRSDSR